MVGYINCLIIITSFNVVGEVVGEIIGEVVGEVVGGV